MSNPKPHKRNAYKGNRLLGSKLMVYENLYGKPLTETKANELRANLVKYVELLIELDEQHKQWLSQQETLKKHKVTN